MEIVFGMGFISPASEAAVLLTISLSGFLMGISMSERWILMAQWTMSGDVFVCLLDVAVVLLLLCTVYVFLQCNSVL